MFVEEGIDYQFTLHIPLGRGGENIDLLCTSGISKFCHKTSKYKIA